MLGIFSKPKIIVKEKQLCKACKGEADYSTLIYCRSCRYLRETLQSYREYLTPLNFMSKDDYRNASLIYVGLFKDHNAQFKRIAQIFVNKMILKKIDYDQKIIKKLLKKYR